MPLHLVLDTDEPFADEPAASSDFSELRERQEVVLLVDDEPALLDALRVSLRKESYAIETATSAVEALAIMSRGRVDVVVSDERMPGMSGSELLSLVRDRHPETVRIVLTGHGTFEAAARAVNEGGAFRLLSKGASSTELARTIREALRIRNPRRDSLRVTVPVPTPPLAIVGEPLNDH